MFKRRNSTQHNGIQQSNTHHKGFNILVLSISNTQHNNNVHIVHHAECHYAECHVSFIAMTNVIMWSVVMLSVVILNVMATFKKLVLSYL
jgi:hypothetical protein